jgi:hypothetical protein
VFHIYRRKADHICCIRLILEEKWENSERVHQIFVDLKKSYDSIRREVPNNIPIEFGIAMKRVCTIAGCLTILSVMSISFLLHQVVCVAFAI